MSPEVTVIIPCYKVGKYLEQTLNSVIAQSHANIQIIAVDDCSPDETGGIIRDFQKRDSRVQVIFHAENAGVSVARNKGIDAANAPWLVFLDGDDWLPPDAIETLLALQRQTGADLICSNARQYGEDGTSGEMHFRRQKGVWRFDITDNLEEFWPHQDVLCTCTMKLFSAKAVRAANVRFNSALRHAQDTLFTLSFVLTANPSVAIDYDKEVYCYRQNPASCVHAIPIEKRLECLDILVRELDALAVSTKHPRRLAAPKSAEYLWAIKKFSANPDDRMKRLNALVESPLFMEHIQPVLRQYGKFKHRLLLRLLAKGHYGAIRWW